MSTRSVAPGETRREAREAAERGRRRRLAIGAVVAVGIVVAALVVPRLIVAGAAERAVALPPAAESLPVPQVTQVEAAASVCDDPDVQAALAVGDDEAVVIASGGGEAFREAVVNGAAPCVSLSDPVRRWVVVDKLRPLDPIDYGPDVGPLSGISSLSGGYLRRDAADALAALAADAETAGAGRVAMLSGFRSYDTQVSTYAQHVSDEGQGEADRGSARPGYSEHQTGLASDLVACGGGCGTLDDFGSSAQGQWVAAHAWEYGFIVRYEEGYEHVSGYEAEPWHLRYIGPELAKAYHDGGFHTLEDFFGLPPAPDYAG